MFRKLCISLVAVMTLGATWAGAAFATTPPTDPSAGVATTPTYPGTGNAGDNEATAGTTLSHPASGIPVPIGGGFYCTNLHVPSFPSGVIQTDRWGNQTGQGITLQNSPTNGWTIMSYGHWGCFLSPGVSVIAEQNQLLEYYNGVTWISAYNSPGVFNHQIGGMTPASTLWDPAGMFVHCNNIAGWNLFRVFYDNRAYASTGLGASAPGWSAAVWLHCAPPV
jgi:hypothetical protein